MGQQEAPGETEEAKTAAGAVDSLRLGRRPIGSPHLHLRRHYGWFIETTFAEMRAYLGLETTRGWCQRTVLRAEPCLFGLYTVVALLYQQLPEPRGEGGVDWAGKEGVTFSDAITVVRRWLWANWAFATAGHEEALAKLPEPVRNALLYALAPAACPFISYSTTLPILEPVMHYRGIIV